MFFIKTMINIYITETLHNAETYFNRLDEASQERIKTFKLPLQQAQRITGDLLLKAALRKEGYFDYKVIYTPKLMLENNVAYISKSHSHNYVMVVITNELVGCDIELVKEVKIQKKVLALNELEVFNESENKDLTFMRYWTAKEAYIKYYGGLVKPYQNIVFNIAHQESSIWYGTIDDLYCYQTGFNGYVISTVTKSVKQINFNYLTINELLY